MPIFTTDTFTDTTGVLLENHTWETGAVWTKSPAFATGSAAITAAGRVRGNGGAAVYYASAVPASADYDVEADFFVATNANAAGLFGRLSATVQTYYLFDYEGGANFKLYSVVNGTAVTVTPLVMSLTAGQTYHLRLSMRGTQITCFVNNTQIIQVNDANVTAAGRAGVFFSAPDSDSTGYHLDAFNGSVPSTLRVTDGNLFFSPYNWQSDGAGAIGPGNVNAASNFAQSNTPGAYLKFGLNAAASGNATLLLDTSSLSGITAANCPTLSISIDGGTFITQLLASATGVTRVPVAANLTAGPHTAIVHFRSVNTNSSLAMGDRWNTPASTVKITGLELDGKGSATVAPTTRPKRLLVFGDSITEGVNLLGTSGADSDADATQTYAHLLGAALGAEVGAVGFAAQGWTTGGFGNVPVFFDVVTPGNSAFDKYFAGTSRLRGGALSPAPDYIVVIHGRNDAAVSAADAAVTSAVTAWLQAIRADAPTSRIIVVIPVDGSKRSAITAGFTAVSDANSNLIDLGVAVQASFNPGGLNTLEGVHPNARGHATLAALLLERLESLIGGATSSAASAGQFSGAGVMLTDGVFSTA